MTPVAVVAHQKKTLGGGLDELRRLLRHAGFADPLWYEVPKSKKAPKAARQALADGADLILAWGGDGTVQRVIDVIAGSGATLGVLPAGTANLFATNLGIPDELPGALETALHGARRTIDVGEANGERFGVMAGAGFDASMIERADRALKDRVGHLAYVWTGVRATREGSHEVKVDVDGQRWFEGKASCVLIGQMGTLTGGLVAFPDADPADGRLEVGVVTADSALDWARVATRLATGKPEKSPFTRNTSGKKVKVRFDSEVRYELDGGARTKVKKLVAKIHPGALVVAVPEASS